MAVIPAKAEALYNGACRSIHLLWCKDHDGFPLSRTAAQGNFAQEERVLAGSTRLDDVGGRRLRHVCSRRHAYTGRRPLPPLRAEPVLDL